MKPKISLEAKITKGKKNKLCFGQVIRNNTSIETNYGKDARNNGK
jgi:hypothetical protein